MKKLVSVLFASLLVGSFAFAEVSTGAWGRFLFAPAAAMSGDFETDDNLGFSGPNWGGRGRVGVNFSGKSDNVGFNLNVDSNGNTLGVGDQAKMWVAINPMIKIEGGKIQGDVLRGKIDNSSFLGAIANFIAMEDDPATPANEKIEVPFVQTTTGKDDIFARFYPQSGILVDITPAEGVYLGAALDADASGVVLTEDMMKKVQIGAGYVIANMGHLRAQYIGNVDDAAKYMNVAFAYTAMEGLLVDAGLKYQTEADAGQSSFTVHATYNKDALAAIVRAQVKFGDDVAVDDELGYKVSADLGYKVADPLSVGAEVSFAKQGDPICISILPYGKLGYGSGYLKAGFEYSSFTDAAFNTPIGVVVGDYTSWAIPIIMEYGF